MRFVMLMYPGPAAETERSPIPEGPEGQKLLEDMMAFNQRMVDAGVMLGGEGLKPTRAGARVKYQGGGKTIVVDGPFTETKELIAGYTLIQVRSRDEALEWTRRFPNPRGEGLEAEIEVRQLYEMEDFAGVDGVEQFRDLGTLRG